MPLLHYPEGVTGAATTPVVYDISLGKYDATLGFNWLVLHGSIPAVGKWLLEWTKVAAVEGRPVGRLFWAVADAATFVLGRTIIRSQASQPAGWRTAGNADAAAAPPAAASVRAAP